MTNDIYTYIFENFNIKVTDYTFKRDYILNPLKWGEKPHKDNKNYFFIKRQFSQNVLLSVFKAARK